MSEEKIIHKAEWNPVTNTTTITDGNGTTKVPGNQVSNTKGNSSDSADSN